MGCASSTEVGNDGRNRHKMGGSYPGNRRPQQQPYSPPETQFQNGTATAHFVSYGGGNALVQQQNGVAQPETGGKDNFVQVTLPQGVHSGQTIHVRAPDGRMNEIVVPPGFGPGSTFTVEFTDEEAPPPPTTTDYYGKPDKPVMASPYDSDSAVPAATATTSATYGGGAGTNDSRNDVDDGFATGFNNPNFVPTATATATMNTDPEVNYSTYPSATDAKPVYSAPPSYPSAKPY